MNSPLINYALAGLDRCWLPDAGCWSHIYHLDGRTAANESLPHSDVFYTLNVLLSLARVPSVPSRIDIGSIYKRNASRLIELPSSKYAFGMALWAAAEHDLEVPTDVLPFIDRMLSDRACWETFSAQDLGMILIGVVAQARRDPRKWAPLADELFGFLAQRYRSESDLFYDGAVGLRRRFSSFATQTYLTLASYIYGQFSGDGRAIEIANHCVRKLISLQGPNGEWPWFFDSAKGDVVDFYEVYSVHQYGMAPAFLEHAERHNVPGAREALVRGFKWIFGANQLEVSMLRPELQLTIRSQVRKGELTTRMRRMLRALAATATGKRATLIGPENLELRMECRSYELGWILWSFGQRTDLPELTHHEDFAAALGAGDDHPQHRGSLAKNS